ncbi:MAG: MBL fold metallo-hydrolase [Bdellovibrionales bacterium]
MKVHLWGIRGSLPAPHTPAQLEERLLQTLEEFVAYQSKGGKSVKEFLNSLPHSRKGGFGGHTACIQVTTPKANVIIDGGSGLRRLGEQLVMGPCGLGRGEVHILFTHFHWDHLIGLPFFLPMFIPGNQIHMYAVQEDLPDHVRSMFEKPRFPVPFDQLGAKIHFHRLSPRQKVQLRDIEYTPYELDHPDPCWGYRFEHDKKVLAYCVDSECIRMSASELGPDLPLYQNVDAMIFDAQYSFVEATERINWGHASAPIGLDLAMREKVKRVFFIHHDPAASDGKIAKIEGQTREYYQAIVRSLKEQNEPVHEVDWCFAREGMVIEV